MQVAVDQHAIMRLRKTQGRSENRLGSARENAGGIQLRKRRNGFRDAAGHIGPTHRVDRQHFESCARDRVQAPEELAEIFSQPLARVIVNAARGDLNSIDHAAAKPWPRELGRR
jgi:hypothetical protein